jgi:mono/diheme cytochrome c family protein
VYAATASPVPIDAPLAGATVVLGRAGTRTIAYVADEDDRTILAVDVEAKKALSRTPLPGRPSQVLLAPDGRLFVTLRDRSEVAVLEPTPNAEAPLEARCTAETAPEPVALALTPDTGTVLVSSGWGRALAGYDTARLARTFQVALPREPRAVVVSDDGSRAFVSHAVGAQVSLVDLTTHHVKAVSVRGSEPGAVPPPTPPEEEGSDASEQRSSRTACQGFALAKSVAPKGRIFAPQVLVDTGDPSERAEGYGNTSDQTEMPDVAVLDSASGTPFSSSLEMMADPLTEEDFRDRAPNECLLPRAAAYDAKDHALLVACVGVDAVVAYDALAARPARAELRRWSVASGPNGIAVDTSKGRAVVWSQFDHALNVIALDMEPTDEKEVAPKSVRIDLPPATAIPNAVALGRQIFHASGDPRISRDGRACASCHPDGRDDALTWATPSGPRRSIMLAGRLETTGPYSWTNAEPSLREHLRTTFERLGGSGKLPSTELDALVTYIQTLPPPPQAASHDVRVERGRQIFASKETGCASCHTEGTLTDGKLHDVKSKTRADGSAAFSTPTLRFIGGTGPYFHDGRYPTLRALLTSVDDKMGHTNHLAPEDLDALEAYLRTL